MCAIWGVATEQCDAVAKATASLLLGMGGVDCGVQRGRVPVFWASWADSLAMIQERPPRVANIVVGVLTTGPVLPL